MEAENNSTSISKEFSAKKLFSKEQVSLQQMEAEFKPRQISVLLPRIQPVIITEADSNDPKKTKPLDITQEIEDDFDYLSKTRNLEIDTPRTRMLQGEILDKFTKDTDVQTRVVIMNKGAAEAAFVYPDGTVFISQSLLNKLDSLDEIAAVLAHEVKHMILKTPSKVREARTGAKKFGVSWIHETAGDCGAPEFLEKAGFNLS